MPNLQPQKPGHDDGEGTVKHATGLTSISASGSNKLGAKPGQKMSFKTQIRRQERGAQSFRQVEMSTCQHIKGGGFGGGGWVLDPDDSRENQSTKQG